MTEPEVWGCLCCRGLVAWWPGDPVPVHFHTHLLVTVAGTFMRSPLAACCAAAVLSWSQNVRAKGAPGGYGVAFSGSSWARLSCVLWYRSAGVTCLKTRYQASRDGYMSTARTARRGTGTPFDDIVAQSRSARGEEHNMLVSRTSGSR